MALNCILGRDFDFRNCVNDFLLSSNKVVGIIDNLIKIIRLLIQKRKPREYETDHSRMNAKNIFTLTLTISEQEGHSAISSPASKSSFVIANRSPQGHG